MPQFLKLPGRTRGVSFEVALAGFSPAITTRCVSEDRSPRAIFLAHESGCDFTGKNSLAQLLTCRVPGLVQQSVARRADKRESPFCLVLCENWPQGRDFVKHRRPSADLASYMEVLNAEGLAGGTATQTEHAFDKERIGHVNESQGHCLVG